MVEFRNTEEPDADWWSVVWPDPGETLRTLGTDGRASFLDLCCGTGRFTLAAPALVDGPVYAYDLDPNALEVLSERAADERIEIETIEGDAMAVSELVEPVEYVLFANTLHGVPEKTLLAERVREAIVPGGRFVVINWIAASPEETPVLGEPRGPPEELRMTPAETVAAVEPAGFEATETVSVSPHHYAVVFERTTPSEL
ncbi:class I SAM-dependent methyltransferase [Natronorarus salvus]|uniref:class I SAM-dependent methyltransferase n=1 Tax=Natronorarus salvus TaxID=3117733 RepID=UPI002F269395